MIQEIDDIVEAPVTFNKESTRVELERDRAILALRTLKNQITKQETKHSDRLSMCLSFVKKMAKSPEHAADANGLLKLVELDMA